MTAGRQDERRETLTVLPLGTQESGAGAVQGGARADGGDTEKSPSEDAGEEVVQGRHGVRPAQGGGKGGRREKTGGETLGVRGDNRGCKASGVTYESSGVGDEEGGREASGEAETPGRGMPRSGRGSQVVTGRQHPRSGRGSPGGGKTQEGPQ